jgi:dihydrofolate synthase/folylpolyglutamate synthase
MVYLPHWPIPSTLGKREIDYESVFERMGIVLEKLGNPHQKLPPVIHVSGTNGKGSSTALIAKIFSCAGKKVHIYTSPHLHDCNERIVLDGEKISDNFLYEVMEETRLAATADRVETPLTFMEAFTIGAFLAFAKTPADLLVVECGLGGRIDATNIIEKKLATVIMPISFDHVEYLGNSIERIALEKAMIMRKETPLIVAPQPSAAKNIIKILAADQKIPAFFYDEDFEISLDEKSGEFDFKFGNIFFENLPKPALQGLHQYVNFATAIAAAIISKSALDVMLSLSKHDSIFGHESCFDRLSMTFKEESILRQAITSVSWPSRLEKIQNNLNKILKNPQSEIWIDGAHNEAGAFALAKWIMEENRSPYLGGKSSRSATMVVQNFVITGFSKNKCKKEFLEKFRNVAEVVAVRVDGEPNPESAEKISEVGAEIGMKIFAAEDLAEAIFYIAKISGGEPCCVVICGSLHLARDVKKFGLN